MKRFRLYCSVLVVLAMAVLSAPTFGALGQIPQDPSAYENLYDPTAGELPDAVATPWVNVFGGDPIASVSGEIANLDFGAAGLWQRTAADHGLVMDKTVGYTLDIGIQFLSTGEPLDVLLRPDNDGLIELRWNVSDTEISVKIMEEGGGLRGSAVVPGAALGGSYNWRFVRLNDDVKIYFEDLAAPVLEATVANAFDPNHTWLYWGDGGGSISGQSSLDYIGLDSSGALMQAPGQWIPEPGSLALLALGGLLIARRRR